MAENDNRFLVANVDDDTTSTEVTDEAISTDNITEDDETDSSIDVPPTADPSKSEAIKPSRSSLNVPNVVIQNENGLNFEKSPQVWNQIPSLYVSITEAMYDQASVQQGTQYLKSLRNYLTRDALPSEDHYRNIMSLTKEHGQVFTRPTLEELHANKTLTKNDEDDKVCHKWGL